MKPEFFNYCRLGWKPKTAMLVKRHEDGSVDLEDEAGNVFVTRCPVYAGPPAPGESRADGWAEAVEVELIEVRTADIDPGAHCDHDNEPAPAPSPKKSGRSRKKNPSA